MSTLSFDNTIAHYKPISSFDHIIGGNGNDGGEAQREFVDQESISFEIYESTTLSSRKAAEYYYKKNRVLLVIILIFTVIVLAVFKPTSSSSQQQQTYESPSSSSSSTTITREFAINILKEYIPDIKKQHPTTYQQKALDWLVSSTKAFDSSDDDDNHKYGLLERFVLAVFYYSTNGENWEGNDTWRVDVQTSWLSTHTVCDWSGIECTKAYHKDGKEEKENNNNNNSIGGKRKIIDFFKVNDKLKGKIPSELGTLTELRELLLSSNELTGSIPKELGNLNQLTRLDLYDNQLSGLVPPELFPILDSMMDCDIGGNPDLKGIPSSCA